MNANQAQAGINRLLQLGETTVPVARVERSVSESSFDQHMREASTQELHSRREPSRSRTEARDAQASSGGETDQGLPRSTSRNEGPQKSDASSEHGKEGVEDEKAVTKAVNGKAEAVVEEEAGLVNGAEGEIVAGINESLVTKPKALTELAPSETLITESVETLEVTQEPVGILNGGVLGEDGNLLNVDKSEGVTPVGGEFALTAPANEVIESLTPTESLTVTESLTTTSTLLPVNPSKIPESVAGSAPQAKVALGLRDPAATSITGLTTTVSGVVPEEGVNEQILRVDPSLTKDATTAAKTPVANMTLTGDQSDAPKPVATMTTQADQWFKKLAVEPQNPELKSAQAGAVSAGTAVSDIARAQSRIASAMLSQGTMGPLQTQVKTPFGATQWGGAVAERVAFLASQRVTAAEIHLDPPELGPLQVRVSLNQEQASVSFVAQHAGVREALDQNAFRLREMFDAEGLNLLDVDVSGQSFAEQDSGASGGEGGNGDEVLSDSDEQPEAVPMRLSLVDHFV